jgi:hypothetical protein
MSTLLHAISYRGALYWALFYMPLVTEERYWALFYVPLVTEERYWALFYMPFVREERYWALLYMPLVTENRYWALSYMPLVTEERYWALFYMPLVTEERYWSLFNMPLVTEERSQHSSTCHLLQRSSTEYSSTCHCIRLYTICWMHWYRLQMKWDYIKSEIRHARRTVCAMRTDDLCFGASEKAHAPARPRWPRNVISSAARAREVQHTQSLRHLYASRGNGKHCRLEAKTGTQHADGLLTDWSIAALRMGLSTAH